MQRVALLNGKNINQDFDLSKIFESLAVSGIFEGLEVRNNEVTKGYAFVEVQRNSKNFYILFENSENFQIDTSGNKKVFIEINQENIDYGINNNENGTEIGSIKMASDYPTKNFLPLASITNGQIRDERVWVTLRDDLISRKIYKKDETYSKNQITEMLAGVNSFAGKTKVNPGEDLNNIKNPGLYYNPANVESDQILNHPKRQFEGHLHNLNDSAFGLLVYEASGVIQELTIFDLYYKFIRRFYGGAWSPWEILYVKGTGNLGNKNKHNIAIGDSDTGFRQNGDGILDCFVNNSLVWNARHNYIEFNQYPFTTQPQHSDGHSLARKDYVDGLIGSTLRVVYNYEHIDTQVGRVTKIHNLNLNEEDIKKGRYFILKRGREYSINLWEYLPNLRIGNDNVDMGSGYNRRENYLTPNKLIIETNYNRAVFLIIQLW